MAHQNSTYLGERLNLSAVARSTLAGQETKRTVTGGFVLEERAKSKLGRSTSGGLEGGGVVKGILQ
ncbi:hypothetical protein TRAPUB_13294 [Trametes pubescens]|uniref:Uncharacterized protein n=1 Tax=Trametes pubescens TaxID=154538 RepID=A0A1M2VRF1_TRAPU|nr:hypothetical protein TRAPUB_13294 [Trametes pubescens]